MSDLITIERPGPPSIVTELAPVVQEARQFGIASMEDHAESLEREKRLRRGERIIHESFEESRKKADEAKKAILSLRDSFIAPIAAARSIYGEKNTTWEQEQRRIADEEARRLQEEARKREEERKIQEAIAAEASGDKQAAEEILAEPIEAPVISVAPQIAYLEGSSTRLLWSAEVTDLEALIVYVAAHPEWASLLEPNMPNLNRLAVSQREALKIPGVKAVSKISRAQRTA